MPDEKFKAFFSQKQEALSSKIARTPMQKFFVFFLILITGSALVLGYLQFRKNLEEPLYSSYLREKRGQLQAEYLNGNFNQVSQTQPFIPSLNQPTDINAIWNQLQNTNSVNAPAGTQSIGNLNSSLNTDLNASAYYGTSNMQDLTDLENKLLSGEVTLQQLGIDDPELQQILNEVGSGQTLDNLNVTNINEANLNELTPEEKQAALAAMKQMPPAQLRSELEKMGIDKSLLDQIDDQTLQQLFLETINSYQ